MDDEWIGADQAYRLVDSAARGFAAETICSRAYDGLVDARTKRLVMGSWSRDDTKVPPKFWWARGGAALEKNWTTGDFETWIDKRIHCRAYGVEFRRADIEAILPLPSQEAHPTGERGGGQPPTGCRLSERWPAWVAELVADIHEKGVPAGVGSQGQEEIITRVADALAARGEEALGRSTVQPVVQAVLDRLRAAKN